MNYLLKATAIKLISVETEVITVDTHLITVRIKTISAALDFISGSIEIVSAAPALIACGKIPIAAVIALYMHAIIPVSGITGFVTCIKGVILADINFPLTVHIPVLAEVIGTLV
jgi:hypothetical protein